MIYLTPNGSTQNQVVYIKNKFIQSSPVTNPDGNEIMMSGFTIAIDQPLENDLSVNWWIIN